MPTDSAPYLKDGSLDFGILWDPGMLGKLTVYVAHDELNGVKIENGMEIPGVGKITLLDDGKTIIMGPPSVWTKDNVDQFKF
jgi:simple sugar transport system substrate-binding protein/rhamnose transport system substrate-binding protein